MVDVQRLMDATRTGGVLRGASFATVLALGLVFYFTPLKSWLAQGLALKAELAGYGLAAPLIFTASGALLTAVGAPRLILCSLGGLAFGFAWGLVWSQAATLLGSYATLLIIRRFGVGYGLKSFRQFDRLAGQIERNGVLAVVLIRQLPLNGFYNNVLLGMTGVGHLDFLMGSFIGFLPMAITACLIGAGLLQADFAKAAEYIALAVGSSAILGYALKRLHSFVTGKNSEVPLFADRD
ncbi:TVP38/TMEM64 family protein [Methylocaldum sp.]|uniref:TVP38/TMEM64 family protein n=1 Tax=Methylocaldum sp. TaxID=1969727 RepID=UPI002D735A85|nr:VTT domain-containing protein [Methylocaldum sp.]HYE34976.1 VTT domain-containing protein [Methylocaldum sp.]